MPLLGFGKDRGSSLMDSGYDREPRAGMFPATGERTRALLGKSGGLLESCSNPACRASWRQLLRPRATPVLEGGWACSEQCTRTLIAQAVRREMDGRATSPESHRHRIPLGLLMMRQGWITNEKLRKAVEAQKQAGTGRLGYWLVRQQGVDEQLITRALALQWGCPMLSMEFYEGDGLTGLVPRLFVDAFGALPLRIAAGKLLYLGFEDRLDPVLALALERMTGLRTENGVVQESHFRPAHTRLLRAPYPNVELIEAVSEPVLVDALVKRVERFKPVESRMVRVHDCLWMRLWRKHQQTIVPELDTVQDLICTIRSH